jgi:hypothetical protein
MVTARRLSENQVKPDKDLRRMADKSIFEFSGKTTVCHIKNRRKLLLPIALILGQAPSVTITILQEGPNVVATGPGTIDLTGLSLNLFQEGDPPGLHGNHANI